MVFKILAFSIVLSCSSHGHKNMNEKFLKKDLDVNSWITRFESSKREVFKYRKEIVRKMKLQKGMVVADIGAGTGAFLEEVSRAVTDDNIVSSRGKVYGVDISSKFVSFMNERVQKEKIKNTEIILGEFDRTTLPMESVDVIFMIDTYHHFENPEKMLADIRATLRPGGFMYIIDFDKDSPQLSSFLKKHIINSKESYINQIKENGFEFIGSENVPLDQNFMISFRVTK